MNDPRASFRSMEASELFCPRCKRAQKVRKHLLLVLPSGNRYEYRCAVCATPVGDQKDNDGSEFAEILRRV